MRTFLECLVLLIISAVCTLLLIALASAVITHPQYMNNWFQWVALVMCGGFFMAGAIISFCTFAVIAHDVLRGITHDPLFRRK